MTSRGASPFSISSSSPGRRPARSAGEPGATATTLGDDIGASVRVRPDTLVRMDVEKVLLARPRGFCAGVEMAIKALGGLGRVFEPPVYCYHEIVHNRLVVERFRNLGVVFGGGIDEGPDGARVMLS